MSTTIVRTNLALDETTRKILKEEAEARGLSVSSFVRMLARDIKRRRGRSGPEGHESAARGGGGP